MNRKGRLAVLSVFAVLCLALPVLFRAQFWDLSSRYREHREALAASARALLALKEQARGEGAQAHALYVEVDLRGEAARVALPGSAETGEGDLEIARTDDPLENFPQLTRWEPSLREAGISSIKVYDFSGPEGAGSPCEVWYEVPGAGGALIWSESGRLTYNWDVTNPDGPGYRFDQTRLDDNWFAAVSRYDPDSSYWRY